MAGQVLWLLCLLSFCDACLAASPAMYWKERRHAAALATGVSGVASLMMNRLCAIAKSKGRFRRRLLQSTDFMSLKPLGALTLALGDLCNVNSSLVQPNGTSPLTFERCVAGGAAPLCDHVVRFACLTELPQDPWLG